MTTDKRKSDPLVRKGARFPFAVSAVAWIDLLGYGGMIAEAGFNPLHPKAEEAIRRLRAFHAVVSERSARSFPTLVMNDGAAAYRDLSFRTGSPTFQFLAAAWDLFGAIQTMEAAQSYPGARMVIAPGFRMRGRRAGMDQTAGHFRSIMERLQSGRATADQAIREASRISRTFDILPQLQANFAFTKAYVAESGGRAAGLGGSRCFVDLAFFDDPLPPWIQVGAPIAWTNERLNLSATFAPIEGIDRGRLDAGPSGARDAFALAQHLAGRLDVLQALRDEPRTSHRDEASG